MQRSIQTRNKLLDLNFSKFPKTKSKLLAELTNVLETTIPQLMAMYGLFCYSKFVYLYTYMCGTTAHTWVGECAGVALLAHPPPTNPTPSPPNINRLPKTTTALKDEQGNAITYSVPVPQRHYDQDRLVR